MFFLALQGWAAFVKPIKQQAALTGHKLKAASQAGAQRARQMASSLGKSASTQSSLSVLLPDLLSKDVGQGRDVGGPSGAKGLMQASLQAVATKTAKAASFSQHKAAQLASALASGWKGLHNQAQAGWKAKQRFALGRRAKAQAVASQLAEAGRNATAAIATKVGQTDLAAKAAWAAAADRAETAAFWAHRRWRSARKNFRLQRKAVGRSFRAAASALRRHLETRRANRSRRRFSRWLVRLLAGGAFL